MGYKTGPRAGGFRRGEGALREPVAAKRIQRGWGVGSRKVFIVVVGSLTPPTLIKQQKQTNKTHSTPRGRRVRPQQRPHPGMDPHVAY